MSFAADSLDVTDLVASARRVLAVGQWSSSSMATVTLAAREALRCQVMPRFDAAVAQGSALDGLDVAEQVLLIHNIAAHLEPGGLLVLDGVASLDHGSLAQLLARSGFELITSGECCVARRTDRVTIHDLVASARSRLVRLTAIDLLERMGANDVPVVLDTRTPTDRDQHGVIPGSIHTPRTVLEWMVDPASGYSHPAISGFEQQLVVVCNEGYSSSLAAATLQDLGFRRATDLVGGMAAWISAGFPIQPPDSHHQLPMAGGDWIAT
jgi:rhodanese-related sulfurtransferase